MMLHNVYFWLRTDLTPAEVKEFEAGLRSLSTVPSVRQAFHGKPSSTNRPIIDRTYSYGLILAFDNLAGHDAYQVHPIHQAFVDQNKEKWTSVRIYDFE